MGRYRPVIPPEVAAIIRGLHPDLRRSIRNTLRVLSDDPSTGELLRRELEGLWRFRVRRFRIVYAIDRPPRIIQVIAVGHRRTIYDEVTATRMRRGR
jgi:mRNA interferase RelE/StbE